jgi:uncharacterized protein
MKLAALALLAAGLSAVTLPAAADSLLTVTGRGSATVSTLDAHITGTADAKGATTAEAIAASRATTANILKALEKLGVPEKDFAITGLNINPQYGKAILPEQPRPITSYTCNTNIAVTIEHSEQLGDILQTLAAAGVNQSERVTYLAHDSETAMAEARAAAVKDAFARGKVLAGQTGVTLGRVIAVSDGIPVNSVLNYAEQMLAALGNGGANHNVIATVTVSWEIK